MPVAFFKLNLMGEERFMKIQKSVLTLVLIAGILVLIFYSMIAFKEKKISKAPSKENFDILCKAVEQGSLDAVKKLIESGIPIEGYMEGDHMLLPLTAFMGHTELIKYFLDMGADPNKQSEDIPTETALHVVCQHGWGDMAMDENIKESKRLEIAKLLIDAKADVNRKTILGYFMDWTPLHGAAGSGSVSLVKLLIENGADVKAVSSRGYFAGYTPLHEAVNNDGGSINVVELLITHGADINAKSGKGETPLDLAENEKIKMLLVKHGAVKGK